MKYLKWVLGLHRRTTNIAVYGDTGRYPIAIKIIPQCVKYFRRLALKSTDGSLSLVDCAFMEQKNVGLDWYKSWNAISEVAGTPDLCKQTISQMFITSWDNKRKICNKLSFNNSVKDTFSMEEFLNIKDANSRKAISRIRSSAHDLNIELGRYQKKCGATPFLAEKACRLCCDRNSINDLQFLAN